MDIFNLLIQNKLFNGKVVTTFEPLSNLGQTFWLDRTLQYNPKIWLQPSGTNPNLLLKVKFIKFKIFYLSLFLFHLFHDQNSRILRKTGISQTNRFRILGIGMVFNLEKTLIWAFDWNLSSWLSDRSNTNQVKINSEKN